MAPQLRRLVEAITSFTDLKLTSPIHPLSNRFSKLQSGRWADWRRTIDVDLNAQFYCTKYAIPMLKASGGGSIVMMASNAALFGYPLRSPYTAAKWALIGLTKTLAMELGPHGIRVNALCPCSVEGPRIDGVIEREAAKRGVSAEKVREDYQRQSSLRTFVSPGDVAAMALFLVSDLGAKISGQAIGVDGHTESLAQL